MKRYFFNVSLTVEQCQAYYQGQVKYVLVFADSGEKVQLPFRHFQPFISHLGIYGRFRLTLDNSTAFVALDKIN